jgi:hypothetical protein
MPHSFSIDIRSQRNVVLLAVSDVLALSLGGWPAAIFGQQPGGAPSRPPETPAANFSPL